MAALKEILESLPLDDLTALGKTLHMKPAEATPPRLAQQLERSARTRKRFSELLPEEKHVLRYVLSQGGAADEAEILRQLPEAPAALSKLRDAYLLFREPSAAGAETRWCMPREFARFVSLTPAEKSTLANFVLRQPAGYGEVLSQAHGWPLGDPRAPAEALKKRWLDETALKAAIENLTEDERGLWKVLTDSEGIVDAKLLFHGGAIPSLQPGLLDASRPLDRLYALGLVFPNRHPPTCFMVPSDVLSTFYGKTRTKSFTQTPQAPAHLRSWGLRILSDLRLYAAYQSSGRLQFTQSDIPLRHQLRAFLKAIGVQEETYGLFLNMSLDAFMANVIRQDTQTLDANPAESMSRLIGHWRGSDRWQESSHWRAAQRNPDGQIDRTLESKRLVLLKALEDLPTRSWVPYAEFEAHVLAKGWKRVDLGASSAAYYHNERWPRRPFVPDLSAPQTLATMVAECLTWLGLVDVGLKRERKSEWELSHLRLTDWGRQFLDKKSGRFEPLPPVPAEARFRVLPNLEIHASPHLRPDLLAALFRIAALRGVDVFALTKESLREALDEGQKPEDLLAFLSGNSSTPLPAMVEQFVREMAEKHGHIKLGIAGAYLQVDDPVLLAELRAQRSLQEIFRKQVGDRLAILSDSDLERIAKALRKLGYFPVIEKSPETERLKLKFRW